MNILKTYKIFESKLKGIDKKYSTELWLDLINCELQSKFDDIYPEKIYNILKAGIDINMIGIDGKTLLIRGAYFNNFTITKILVNAGANLNLQDKDGITALIVCTDIELIKYLINAGADMTIKTKHGYDFITATDYSDYPDIFKWFHTEEAQRLILSRDPLMFNSFEEHDINFHPNIIRDFPHLFTANDLNLL